MATQCLLLVAFASAAQADEVKILQTIRAAARENFTSIHSLELRFHYHEVTTDQDFVSWEWAIQGNKCLLRHETGSEPGRTGPTRIWTSFDGQAGYYIDYDPGDLSQVRSILRSSWVPRQYTVLAIPPQLFGWILLTANETFLGLLDASSAKLNGNDGVDGYDCWKVDLGTTTYKGKATNRLTAWFDPAVGYWPRKISMWPANLNPGIGGQEITIIDGQMFVAVHSLKPALRHFGRFVKNRAWMKSSASRKMSGRGGSAPSG